MFRMIPPAGTPISQADLIRVFLDRFSSSTDSNLEKKLMEYTGAKRMFSVSSGQAAQYLFLRAFMNISDTEKNEVVIPAYTCYTVAASIARAGLKIHPVDIDPATLDYDYEKLQETDFSKVLAINSSNLFGILSDWSALKAVATRYSVFTIDDAAQSFGSETDGRKSGTNGDGGFYSLGRGKNLSAWAGGLMVSSNQRVIEELIKQVRELKIPGLVSEMTTYFKYAISSLVLLPALYRLPASLPFLKLGETIYDESFEVEKLTKIQIAAALTGLRKLDQWNKRRATNAKVLARTLTQSGKYKIPGYDPNKPVNYLRLPVLAENRKKRNDNITKLAHIGVIATRMYPTSIPQITEIQSILANKNAQFPGANTVVDRLFTLPTHPYVTDQDIERMIGCLT